ncbi:MAG: hypothetical protein BroJett003_14520 [Planctomycetota bacterium]|nr:MAG: hypothetical protein BroJett003_14520 [Planctomycetota bacterium]
MSDHPKSSNPSETSPGAASAANPAEIAGAPSAAASPAGATAEKADDVVLSPAEIEALRVSAAAPTAEAAGVAGAATAAEASDGGAAASPGAPLEAVSAHPLEAEALPRFDRGSGSGAGIDALDMLYDVNLQVTIELGRTRMLVEDVLKLGEGSVVELDRLAGDPVDIYANERLIARGEILVLNDNFCVRVSEVLTTDPHRIGAA